MPKQKGELSDRQWKVVSKCLPKKRRGAGRPVGDQRAIIEGIIWVARTGARWRDVPRDSGWPSGVTCWRWLGRYQAMGIWDQVWQKVVNDLAAKGRLNLDTMYADGTFAAGKKGGYISA